MVGMNPGPFGMAQTGVPFGDVTMVRDFLGIRDRSEACARASAAADRRLRLRALGGERHPLLGLGARPLRDGRAVLRARLRRELVPARLHGRVRTEPHAGQAARLDERAPLFQRLRRGAREDRRCARPDARRRHRPLRRATGARGARATGFASGSIPHPSPASPAANRGWAEAVDARLRELGFEPARDSVGAMRRPTSVELMLLTTVVLWALNLSITKYILEEGVAPLAYARFDTRSPGRSSSRSRWSSSGR